MRIIPLSVVVTAAVLVATVGVAFAQLPGEPKPPPPYDAVADMQYTFARGAPDAVVRDAQRALAGLGYYTGPIDGILAPDVRRAVWRFQKAGRLRWSGSLDGRTVAALGVGPVPVASPPESFSYALPGGPRPSQLHDVQAP